MASVKAYAQLITSREGGTTLYYNVLSESEVEVTYPEGELTTYSGAITIPESITYFGKQLSVTRIGEDAFRDCIGLTSITIPGSVKSVGSWAFRGCTGLEKVIVKDLAAYCGIDFDFGSSPFIGNEAYLYSDENTKITDLVIPNGVTRIGDGVFNCYQHLKSVTIPNSVTSI